MSYPLNVAKGERFPVFVILICIRDLLRIVGTDNQFRRVRGSCENGGGTVRSMQGTADGIIGYNTSHNAAHRTLSFPGMYPVLIVGGARSSWLFLIIECEVVDPNVKAQVTIFYSTLRAA